MNNDKAQPLVGIILTVLSVLLVVGVLTFAKPCDVHGVPSSCVWASRAVLGAGVVAFVLSAVRIFERDEGERRGLCLGVALVGILIACLPGVLIELCADASLPCNAVMRPFCMGVGIALAAAGGGDLTLRVVRLAKPNDEK